MDAVFDPDRKAGELIESVDRIQRTIRKKLPSVKYIYIDPESSREQRAQPHDQILSRAS